MAKSDKTEKTAKKAPRTKVSKLDKALRKLNGTSAKTPFSMKTAQFTVTGFSRVPVEIPGYLQERSETHTVWRHKKTSASKQMIVTVVANSDVVELLGDDKGGSITVIQRKPFTKATGTLKFNGTDIVIRGEGGNAVFAQGAGVDYEISAVDSEGSQASNRGRSAAADKPEKKSKVTNIKDGNKKSKK